MILKGGGERWFVETFRVMDILTLWKTLTENELGFRFPALRQDSPHLWPPPAPWQEASTARLLTCHTPCCD